MLISVIVPIYKVEDYIHRCIDSILAQTFTDFELILVDDGSPDKCGKICDEYADKDSRIHVIHKENGGLSDARNTGIDWAFANSNSEWITFIDSDDWIHPRYLEALYDAVKKTGCEISICAYEETTGDNPQVDESQLEAEIVNTEDFFCEHNVNAVVAWGKLYKKELFREIRYPVGKLHEDEFTTYKLLFQNEICAFVNQPLYYYFMNTDSITKSVWTPKRLDSIDARKGSVSYFRNNNYVAAYRYAVSHLAENVFVNSRRLIKSNSNNKVQLTFRLRKNMKYALAKGKSYKLFPLEEYIHYYELGFPIKMRCYWYWKAFLRKIKWK